jgi:type IV secretory pathway VirB10-like protein
LHPAEIGVKNVMQIFKLLPTVCAALLCASFISVRADDTPVQAALRAALEQKMSELDKQQTQAPPVVVTSSGTVAVQSSQPATNPVPATTPETSAAPASKAIAPTPTPPPVAPEPKSAPAEPTDDTNSSRAKRCSRYCSRAASRAAINHH